MSVPAWHEEPIGRSHAREAFNCGDAKLNEFLQRFARQSHERGASKTFVAVPVADGKTVLGYYSVCPAAVEFARVPEFVRKGLARFDVPAFRLVRLAVDTSVQGQGLGAPLLLAAGRRCLRAAQEVGGVVLLIDAKNSRVADWYALYGAIALADDPLILVLPLTTIKTTLDEADRR